MSKSEEKAQAFLDAVKKSGWEIVRVGNHNVTISKDIGHNNREGFVEADSEYYGLLDLAPGTGGSIWGTDGGGIGALYAMTSGRFVMNKSGVQIRFTSALKKMI